MAQASSLIQTTQLSSRERALLLLPLVASTFVGVMLLFFPTLLASLSGYKGNDLYIYWLCGAATIGYPVALGFALREGTWASIRIIVAAFFTFGIGSLIASGIEIAQGRGVPVVYTVLGLTIIFVLITGTLLYTHQGTAPLQTNVASWLLIVVGIATVLAAFFGVVPLLVPTIFGHLAGFKATDLYIYEQAGAATLGYAIMGILELRSRNWLEMRWPTIMAAVFNGVSFLVSILAIVLDAPLLLPILVTPVGLGIALACFIAFRRSGR